MAQYSLASFTGPADGCLPAQLFTVTYGTACAPYQAVRVLLQLADDKARRFPLAAEILRNNFYVDDARAGADTVEEAMEKKKQLRGTLAVGGLDLDKWAANDPALLQDIIATGGRAFTLEDTISTLGLRWMPHADTFNYQVQRSKSKGAITKKIVLGEIARLHDHLGWLAPVTIRAKILLQILWMSDKDWDTPVDEELQRQWQEFRTELNLLEHLCIPRWFGTHTASRWVLHGVSDASKKAYTATVYLVLQNESAALRSTLITGKRKVAPIKTISLPWLELCGTLLLCRLMCRVREDL